MSGYSGLLKSEAEFNTLKTDLESMDLKFKVSVELPSMEDVFVTLMGRGDN